MPPPPGLSYPPSPPPAGRRPAQTGLWVLTGAATITAIAALVIGIIAVSQPAQTPSAPTTVTAAPAAPGAPVLFDDDADRALCESIVDLMRQRSAANHAFMALPPVTSPERNADADPKFKAEVQDWAQRTQKVLSAHATPDRYLSRTLQRYIDDMLLFAQNIEPGKVGAFDTDTWNLGAVDYGGPRGRCRELGIRWS